MSTAGNMASGGSAKGRIGGGVAGGIVAGLGCRAGCALEQVLDVLQQTLTAEGRAMADVQALHTVDFKHAEPALRQAALLLQKPLIGFSLEQLRACSAGARTHSKHTLQRFGVPSIAETAALAGAALMRPARGAARLLGARRSSGGATCALAEVAALSDTAPLSDTLIDSP